jgi:uncharacterized protein (DUF1501 family)
MSVEMNRRKFLKILGAAGAASLLSNPSLDFAATASAQSSATRVIDNLIVVHIYGGIDGLTLFPPYDIAMYDALRAKREYLMTTRDSGNPIDSLSLPIGNAPFGIHPHLGSDGFTSANSLQSMHELALNGELRLLPAIGYLDRPNLNHQTATNDWNIGALSYTPASSSFWLSRMVSAGDLNFKNIYLLGESGDCVPYRADSAQRAPVATNQLSDLRRFNVNNWDSSLGGRPEGNRAHRLFDELLDLELQKPNSEVAPVQREYMDKLQHIFPQLRELTPISSYDLSGSPYLASPSVSPQIPDTARIIGYLRSSGSGLGSGRIIVRIGYGNMDTHEDQVARLSAPGAFLTRLNDDMAALVKFLKQRSYFQRTAIVFMSEFGRAVYGFTGTQHGWGNFLPIVSGAFAGSGFIVGGGSFLPVLSNITSPDIVGPAGGGQDVIRPRLDIRDVLWEVAEAFGYQASDIFPSYSPQRNLDLFSGVTSA